MHEVVKINNDKITYSFSSGNQTVELNCNIKRSINADDIIGYFGNSSNGFAYEAKGSYTIYE